MLRPLLPLYPMASELNGHPCVAPPHPLCPLLPFVYVRAQTLLSLLLPASFPVLSLSLPLCSHPLHRTARTFPFTARTRQHPGV